MAQSERAAAQAKAKLFKVRVQEIKALAARKDGLDQEKVLHHVASKMYLPKEQRTWIWS